ncbi:MAG: hypothetical protein ABJF88_18375 [Rhodothermales bacterium]
MTELPILTSLTRHAPLDGRAVPLAVLGRERWATGDLVAVRVTAAPVTAHLELVGGRMRGVLPGDLVVGALGHRYATLEVTGSWEAVEADGRMQFLTSAGLLGAVLSCSPYVGGIISVRYEGHVLIGGTKATMERFVEPVPARPWTTPTLLLVGTSMSSGKTTAARVLIRRLVRAGHRVLGAKLTGAGRYRDIQAMADAGAEWIYDFVDAGLPSTVHPAEAYRAALAQLLARMAAHPADVAVVEIGSSPLERYNGAAAAAAVRDAVGCTVLCASDPYAVVGAIAAFGFAPDLVSGIATNTEAGLDLLARLTDVPALNMLDPASYPALDALLARTLAPPAPVP